jgi:hypothetical protein
MSPQLLLSLKNKFAPQSEPAGDADIYYHPYPFGLEIILIILLGLAGGLIFSNTSPTPQLTPNQPANNNSGNSGAIATGINDTDFNRAMPHILRWEGQCSDHPKDPGGRTYKGITKYEASRIGISDPCTMTDDQVFKVYHDRYWVRVPKTLNYPEKLVYFNLIINGTKGRCLKLGNASAMLDCQENHYRSLGNFRYFGGGWINRNNYFKAIIAKI